MCIFLQFTEDRVIYIWGIPTRKAFDPFTKNKQYPDELSEENQKEDEAKVENIKVKEEAKKTKAILNYPHAKIDIIPGMEEFLLKLKGPKVNGCKVQEKSNFGSSVMTKHTLCKPILKWKMMTFNSHVQVGAFSVSTYLSFNISMLKGTQTSLTVMLKGTQSALVHAKRDPDILGCHAKRDPDILDCHAKRVPVSLGSC